jgi:hypothetical protein
MQVEHSMLMILYLEEKREFCGFIIFSELLVDEKSADRAFEYGPILKF